MSAHSVALAPPTGRNFGSLFDLARSADWDEGVVVCHLHTKKSPQFEDEKIGERWLSFLVQSLGHGGDAAGIRAIASQFSRNDDLGLVFPVDPVLVGVEGNRVHIDRLVKNFGLESSPYQEDFPVGGMFWVRGNVIRLVAERFASLECDSEPIPLDGSVLHALERVIPRAVLSAGYSSALSFLPGARRE
jgi:lipopolysaccharide biosynthesis protein